jgi:hypothetical protein
MSCWTTPAKELNRRAHSVRQTVRHDLIFFLQEMSTFDNLASVFKAPEAVALSAGLITWLRRLERR